LFTKKIKIVAVINNSVKINIGYTRLFLNRNVVNSVY